MGLFGRRGQAADDEPALTESQQSESSSDPIFSTESSESPVPAAEPARANRTLGPWDDEDSYPDIPRIDLGGLIVPQSTEFRIQVQADQSSGVVSQVSFVTDTSAVQLQPYAASRSGGMWEEVRGQISSQINKSGGLVEEVAGPFGVELRAQVQGQDGKAQPARFCGVDGPRWFLRLVFLGQAARDAGAAAGLETAVRGIVVVRGDQAMPMGNAIPMRVPVDPDANATAAPTPAAPERPRISLPERGPEITEIR